MIVYVMTKQTALDKNGLMLSVGCFAFNGEQAVRVMSIDDDIATVFLHSETAVFSAQLMKKRLPVSQLELVHAPLLDWETRRSLITPASLEDLPSQVGHESFDDHTTPPENEDETF